MGSAHPLSAPYQAFPTKDGWINLGASNQRTWLKLVEVLDDPELAADPRFKENAGRMGNLPALVEVLTRHFKKRTTAEWLTLLERAGVPAGPVLSIREMHAHPQTIAREMVPEVEHPVAGKVQTIGLPVKFSKTPGKVANPAPLFGQHTREVLAELGYSSEEIEKLIAERAVGAAG
jgi:crotonobetainyl-CoA:carnitine CoA-transferase CaiB-like acyl-CoA transferase